MITTKTSVWVLLKNGMYIPAFVLAAGISVNAINALAVLVMLDTVLGILKVVKIDGWRSVTSRRLAGGVISKLVLLLVPVTLALASLGVGVDIKWLVQSSITVLILSETYSVLGNIHSINTGKETPEFDAVQFILLRIKSLLDKLTR
ncbi:phage holin family protein [Candidatus Babeliales bacterium]|nr:phage holin family protein [Candidatus Babeliales bacterium]